MAITGAAPHPARPRQAALAAICLLLVACGPPAEEAPPAAASPSPAIGPTPSAQASATFSPLTEDTPAIVLEPPELSPTLTPGPPPVRLPDSPIAMFEPGPGSQVLTGFRVVGRGGPSFEERVRLRLLASDGSLLHEKTTILFAFPGNAGRFVTFLYFEQAEVADLGRIQLDTFDRRYGRLAHRFTQELVLLTVGPGRLRPGHQGPARLAILSPQEGARLPMGTIRIEGGGWTEGDGRLVVQAIDGDGTAVATTDIQLSSGASGSIGTFEAELEVNLAASQYGRLAVAELDPGTGEPVFLYSLEVHFRR